MPSKALTNDAILRRDKTEITQFTLKVNMYEKGKESLLEIDLDLNPYDKIYEKDEVVLNEKHIKQVFEYITGRLFKSLQRSKAGKFERIGRIRLKKNSPASLNVTYVSSHNGDMKPPL